MSGVSLSVAWTDGRGTAAAAAATAAGCPSQRALTRGPRPREQRCWLVELQDRGIEERELEGEGRRVHTCAIREHPVDRRESRTSNGERSRNDFSMKD